MDATRPIIDIDGTAYSATPGRDLEHLLADLHASPPLAVVTGLAGGVMDVFGTAARLQGDAAPRFREAVRERYAQLVAPATPYGAH